MFNKILILRHLNLNTAEVAVNVKRGRTAGESS